MDGKEMGVAGIEEVSRGMDGKEMGVAGVEEVR